MLYFRKSDSSAPDNSLPPAKHAHVEEPSSAGEAIAQPEKILTKVSQDPPLPPSSPASTQDVIPQPEETEDIPKVTVASAPELNLAESTDKGKAIAQEDSSVLAKMLEAVGTMSELCKGMEWPVHFSTLILCAMNDWSPTDPIDDQLISEP